MYKTILVPVALDHTGRSEVAVDIARTMLDEGGQITLLHVIEPLPGFADQYLPADAVDKRIDEAKTDLKTMAKTVGGSTRAVVTRGQPGTMILEQADTDNSDCIVIASHRPGLQDYFLGSTAARVVRHAPCSVHVIR
ncbi:MAG: universal stress protein [Rhodobiaceae bacterium]|nr:universal stress protein [Rhodobiaceae bacterium]